MHVRILIEGSWIILDPLLRSGGGCMGGGNLYRPDGHIWIAIGAPGRVQKVVLLWIQSWGLNGFGSHGAWWSAELHGIIRVSSAA